jgi:hypothetical protein
MLFLLALLGCDSEPKRTLGSNTKLLSEETVQDKADKSVQLKFDPFQIHQWVTEGLEKEMYPYLENAGTVTLDWEANHKIVLLSKHKNYKLKGSSPQYLSTFVLPKGTTSQRLTDVGDSFFDALYGQFKKVSTSGQYVPAFKHPDAKVKSGLFHIQSSSDIGVGIATLSVISSKSRKELAGLGATIKGIPFDGLPSHPIFQTELSGQTDIPNQSYALSVICWGGENPYHWPNAQLDDASSNVLAQSIQFKKINDQFTQDQKQSILSGKNIARNNLQHNHCQLWSLPLEGSALYTYFDKPSYLIANLTSESDDGKHVWSMESDDPRLEPGNAYSMEWSALQKQLSDIDVTSASKDASDDKGQKTDSTSKKETGGEEGTRGSTPDTSTTATTADPEVKQVVAKNTVSAKIACSKRLNSDSVFFEHANIWLKGLGLPLIIREGQFEIVEKDILPEQERLLCTNLNVFFNGFHDAAQCRPDVAKSSVSTFKAIESCLEELASSNKIILGGARK